MFRRWDTILGPEDLTDDARHSTAELDADVIMTAVLLGFTASRLAVGHPVEFSVDSKDGQPELDKLKGTVAQINNALGDKYRAGGVAKAVFAPAWEEGALITGAVGSASKPFAQRHAKVTDESAKELREIASAGGDQAIGYQGRGAYTGFVNNPIGSDSHIMSTVRYNVPRDGHGDRWVPPTYNYYSQKKGEENKVIGTQEDRAWGLIAGLKEVGGGMKQHPYDLSEDGNVVAYTHGMIQAIYEAVQAGPWCTPYEIAVGTETTKMASCFTCSLFMYAAGFPPSNIHIGKGESWAPFYPVLPDQDTSGSSNKLAHTDLVIMNLNDRWQLECLQHIQLGIEIMQQNDKAAVKTSHHDRLDQLVAYLKEFDADPYIGGNLVLDAVTVHKSESVRINSTLVAVG